MPLCTRVITAKTSKVDIDAKRFIDASGITIPAEKKATDTLVKDLKRFGLWDKMKAVYPFAAQSASTHKWNLKDPRDLDAAYRLTFANDTAGAHTVNGYKGNGTNQYANTFLNPSTVFGSNQQASYGYYCRTSSTGSTVDMGVAGGTSVQFISRLTASNTQVLINNRGGSFAVSDGLGLIAGAANSPTNDSAIAVVRAYRNGVKFGKGSNYGTPPTNNLYLGGRNNNGTADAFSSREIAFVFVATELFQGDIHNLNEIVESYLTAKGNALQTDLTNKAFFFGDSITEGQVGTATTITWTTELSAMRGWNEVNFGISGTTQQTGASANYGPPMISRLNEIPDYNAKCAYLFFAYGTNDILMFSSYNNTTYQQNYRDIIAKAVSRGWPKSKIVLLNNYYIEQYDLGNVGMLTAMQQGIKDVGAEQGVQVMDIYAHMVNNGGASLVQTDKIHPNDSGHTSIKNYINSTLV